MPSNEGERQFERSDRSEQMKAIENWSTIFVTESTALSAQLVTLESWLESLSARMPVEVTEKDLTVSLGKHGSGEWGLYAILDPTDVSPGSTVRLRNASVVTKARAARLLPQLIDELLRKQQYFAEQALSARQSLDTLFNQLGIVEKRQIDLSEKKK